MAENHPYMTIPGKVPRPMHSTHICQNPRENFNGYINYLESLLWTLLFFHLLSAISVCKYQPYLIVHV